MPIKVSEQNRKELRHTHTPQQQLRFFCGAAAGSLKGKSQDSSLFKSPKHFGQLTKSTRYDSFLTWPVGGRDSWLNSSQAVLDSFIPATSLDTASLDLIVSSPPYPYYMYFQKALQITTPAVGIRKVCCNSVLLCSKGLQVTCCQMVWGRGCSACPFEML